MKKYILIDYLTNSILIFPLITAISSVITFLIAGFILILIPFTIVKIVLAFITIILALLISMILTFLAINFISKNCIILIDNFLTLDDITKVHTKPKNFREFCIIKIKEKQPVKANKIYPIFIPYLLISIASLVVLCLFAKQAYYAIIEDSSFNSLIYFSVLSSATITSFCIFLFKTLNIKKSTCEYCNSVMALSYDKISNERVEYEKEKRTSSSSNSYSTPYGTITQDFKNKEERTNKIIRTTHDFICANCFRTNHREHVEKIYGTWHNR